MIPAVRIAILAPVLERPERARPLVESIAAAATHPTDVFFLISPDDEATVEAVCAAGHDRIVAPIVVSWQPGQGDYAKKINHGFRYAHAAGYDWVFLGADDLHFHPGWDEAAIRRGAELDVCVVGTNDLGNPTVIAGKHATHSLVHRDYLDCGTIDEDGLVLHEGYHHNWVDTEFVATAKLRDTFTVAADSVVEHLHPFWKKGAEDATYRKGRERYHDDRRLHESRRCLWELPPE